MLSIDLKGKISLITGATGQLGRTISKTLAECGSDVVLCYHQNTEKAIELQAEITEKYGVNVMITQSNIRSLDDIMNMKEDVCKKMGSPDIIINCAVSQIQWKTILEQDIKDYVDQFETTVFHNVAMIKAFVPDMIQKHYGRVIGINTECAMQCFEKESAYVAGKRGMDGIYRVLAREIGEYGITVNQVAPGWTFSDRERANGDSDKDGAYAAKVPLKHRGTDQDIANCVAFLASDMAGFISGVYLPVCGGNVMPAI